MARSSKTNQAIERYGEWVLKWRWPIIIASILFAFGVSMGASNLWFNNSYRAFFSDENPQLQSFEKLQNVYTKNDNILFVLAPKDGEVFTQENLKAVEELTAAAWKIPFAIRVDAITNFQHTIAEEDDLLVEDLVSHPELLSSRELSTRQRIALKEPALAKRLVSEKAHVTGINVTLQLPVKEATEVPEAVAYARNLADTIQGQYSNMDIYLTGMVMLNNAFQEAGQKDIMTLIPFMYLVMIIIMIIAMRSISGMFATLLIITFSTMIGMGFAGWFHIGLTPPSAQAPTMIMTLAIADSIHFLITMLREMRRGSTKRKAILESLRINLLPIFLTSVTTAIGFLSMNFSEVPPFQHLGNTTAVGVLFAFIYSILFLPALMSVLPVWTKQQQKTQKADYIQRFSEFVIDKRRPLLWGSALVVIALTSFMARIEFNDQFVNYFDESIQFRTDTDFASENLSGIYQVEFSLDAGENGGISNPEYLEALEKFTLWYEQQPGIVHVNSFSTVMKRLNRTLHGDDDAWYKIPDNRDLAAQYLLLYELSLPYGLDLNNQINVNKSATRLTVTLDNATSREIRNAAVVGEEWLKNNAPEYMHATAASSSVMFAHISERNITGMLLGTFLATILISILLMIALRSMKFGLISLIPNLIPAAVAFGLWGLFVEQVGLGLSIVTSMTLGIVVDDTVHFMSKYLRARREQNLSSEDAVRYSFASVGTALIATTAVLVAGFTVLMFSSFDLNSAMGKLTAMTIVIALVVDFLLLPPLLIQLDKKQNPGSSPSLAKPEQALATGS